MKKPVKITLAVSLFIISPLFAKTENFNMNNFQRETPKSFSYMRHHHHYHHHHHMRHNRKRNNVMRQKRENYFNGKNNNQNNIETYRNPYN